jgi:hypothetical protein
MTKSCLLFSAIITGSMALSPAAQADNQFTLGDLLAKCQNANWCQIYVFNDANLVQAQDKACFADVPSIDIYQEVLPVLRREVAEHPETAANDGDGELGNAIAKLHPCPAKP